VEGRTAKPKKFKLSAKCFYHKKKAGEKNKREKNTGQDVGCPQKTVILEACRRKGTGTGENHVWHRMEQKECVKKRGSRDRGGRRIIFEGIGKENSSKKKGRDQPGREIREKRLTSQVQTIQRRNERVAGKGEEGTIRGPEVPQQSPGIWHCNYI